MNATQFIQMTIAKLKSTDSLQKRVCLTRSIDKMLKTHPVCFAKTFKSNSDARQFLNTILYTKIISQCDIIQDIKSCQLLSK